MKVTDLSLGLLDSTSADTPSQRRKTQMLNRLRWCGGSAHVTQQKHPKALHTQQKAPSASAIALFPQSPKLRGSPLLLPPPLWYPPLHICPRYMWGNSALFHLPPRCPSFKGKTGKMQEGH